MNPRRCFSRLGLAAAALSVPRSAKGFAERPEAERTPWQPTHDAKDDWFDQIPGKHRLFFDTLTDTGLREARAKP